MSQRAFAHAIGATQSMVSRYERGLSNPPAAVVNACMQLMHQEDASIGDISAEQLASKVINNLTKPGYARLRSIIAQLIDGVTIDISADRMIKRRTKS